MNNDKVRLIIEIDKEVYKNVKDKKFFISPWVDTVIANGTPYNPTGDLISREALRKHAIWTKVNNGAELIDIEVVPLVAIDNAPTVEPMGSE